MYERHHLMGKDFFRSDDIPVKILKRNPQPDYPVHSHDFSELVLILDGKGTHFTQKHSFQVSRGDLFVINGDLAHGYKDLENLVLINILFDLEKLKLPDWDISRSPGFHTLFTIEPLLRETSKFSSRLKLNRDQIRYVTGLLDEMEREECHKREGYKYLTASLFMQLIAYLSRAYAGNAGSDHSSLYQLGETISFIEQNLDRNITIRELLEVSHMSASTLNRAFQKITGTSPLDYHLKKKMDRACSLLLKRDSSITMIAYDLGFSDSNYFSRQFRKIIGVTPREFRKRS
ncbi:helix-turn-helix domain-containing protein [Spirochaeta isovalerica]|uniref:AraC-like DNA-binding protein n=1 Tax=Spirochaeta isovalerica TaxID=150 RepID=A0A841R7S4_9SPIO|nr:helix-turn-helix domain-containing protein [Spirochaeta isovalerica]MBB6479876.1 AraC-like DNA-binding protein [Spirochaeta isovalerica]